MDVHQRRPAPSKTSSARPWGVERRAGGPVGRPTEGEILTAKRKTTMTAAVWDLTLARVTGELQTWWGWGAGGVTAVLSHWNPHKSPLPRANSAAFEVIRARGVEPSRSVSLARSTSTTHLDYFFPLNQKWESGCSFSLKLLIILDLIWTSYQKNGVVRLLPSLHFYFFSFQILCRSFLFVQAAWGEVLTLKHSAFSLTCRGW